MTCDGASNTCQCPSGQAWCPSRSACFPQAKGTTAYGMDCCSGWPAGQCAGDLQCATSGTCQCPAGQTWCPSRGACFPDAGGSTAVGGACCDGWTERQCVGVVMQCAGKKGDAKCSVSAPAGGGALLALCATLRSPLDSTHVVFWSPICAVPCHQPLRLLFRPLLRLRNLRRRLQQDWQSREHNLREWQGVGRTATSLCKVGQRIQPLHPVLDCSAQTLPTVTRTAQRRADAPHAAAATGGVSLASSASAPLLATHPSMATAAQAGQLASVLASWSAPQAAHASAPPGRPGAPPAVHALRWPVAAQLRAALAARAGHRTNVLVTP